MTYVLSLEQEEEQEAVIAILIKGHYVTLACMSVHGRGREGKGKEGRACGCLGCGVKVREVM